MSVPTSANSGSLQAEVITVKMDINDDDEDVIIASISISNEAPVPMGGLEVSIITNSGAKHYSQEGVTSLGPGIQREWTFEFPLDSGEWTFVLKGSSDEIKMGPYAYDFEYSVTQGRKLSSNIGSSLFSGAFDQNLGDFGNVKEREMIDPTKVVLTSYAAENSQGGETLIKADLDKLSTGLTSTSSQGAHDAPILNANPIREAPLSQPSRTEDPLLAHTAASPSVREAPTPSLTTEVPLPPPGPPTPPVIPSTPPPTPPVIPSTPPPKPPSGPPTPPSTPEPTASEEVATEPPSGPPSGPPTGPPSGPPAGPPSGPPTGPPSGPPSGPPAGPPSGPPDSSSGPSIEMPDKPDL
tara:strand:- start:1407 stop:2465 length:1059 start_codon:yes stop_codon:yes gene_type:complete